MKKKMVASFASGYLFTFCRGKGSLSQKASFWSLKSNLKCYECLQYNIL